MKVNEKKAVSDLMYIMGMAATTVMNGAEGTEVDLMAKAEGHTLIITVRRATDQECKEIEPNSARIRIKED